MSGEKVTALSTRFCATCPQPPRVAQGHAETVRHDRDAAFFGGRRRDLGGERVQIDGREARPADLRLQPGSFRDIADQPVQPHDIVGHHVHQRRAPMRVLDLGQRFQGAPERRERVFEFVRDFGGEGLGRIDART